MTKDDLDPRLTELLDDLKPVPARDPRAAIRGRSKFLAEAVSLSEVQRHSWWTTIFQQKKFAMNVIASVLVISGLLFGSGATVAAAQDALPTDTLYQVKLLSEDTQLWINTDPAKEVDLLMQQAQTRTEEMAALNSQGITPPAALTVRAQDRIQQALQIASTLNEAEMTDTLQHIRERLQTQDQLLTQSQDETCIHCEPILKQTRDMLHSQMKEVENGLANPQGFIHQHNNVDIPTPERIEAPATQPEIAPDAPAQTEKPNPGACPQSPCSPPAPNGGGSPNGNPETPGPQHPQNGGNNPPVGPDGGPLPPQHRPGDGSGGQPPNPVRPPGS